jgi:cytochrome b pre-mRNA-processing protein 3
MPGGCAAQGGCVSGREADLGLFSRIFGGRDAARVHAPLYAAIVAQARRPDWYRDGGVADTMDGRFDMVSTVLALVLLRLDALGADARAVGARLAELFIDDMDGQLRQNGIGDIVVGKHIGRMMSQLGGRSAAYREALAPGGDLTAALERNVHRVPDAAPATRAVLARDVRALADALARRDLAALIAGDLA